MALETSPPFKLIRSDEDYGYLANPAARRNLDDRLKYIRLGDGAYMSLGGEWRERYEMLNAPKFGIGTASDNYDLQRLLFAADVHFDERVRAFVQIGQANTFGKTSPLLPSDADHLDLANAFVDVKPDPSGRIVVRAGRQEVLLNAAQRFVSVREGPNVRQSFDGLRALWSHEEWAVDVFATRPITYKKSTFDDSSDRSQRFYGVHLTYSMPSKQSLEGYAIELDREGATFGGATGHERRHSFGARWAGAQDGIDQDIEGIYQTGTFAGRDVRAWALGMIGGYTLQEPWAPRLMAELDAGSGNRDPNGSRLQTFNPMFPKGGYFDESALTSWANLVLVRIGIGAQPLPTVSLAASLSERWRQSGRDAVYLQPYVALSQTLTNHARRVGDGLQLDATWRPTRYITLSSELLHQRAGPAIRLAGGHAVTFAMFVAQIRF